MMSFRVLGIITGNKFQETLIELGVIIDAVLISLALADKLRKLRMDKERSQESELAAVAEKERLIIEQNNILERKSSRTKEILEKNDQLELFSQTIKQQNDLLKDYTENLEKQIEARTKEILETNKQLERKTDRLEQFTYIVSHNLKSPVNNLDALLGFVNFDNLSDENKEYFSVIGKTSSQLINIIEEINILVKLDKGTDIEYTEIDLNSVVDNIKDKLIIQIEDTNCLIKTNFQVNKIQSFPAYITSILYNLISNAIKYRSSDRSIEILLESFDEEETTIIKVKDNGHGIAESQLEDVFKLFYKIDYEKEGKGMGLFIVKSQVELLDGKIEITSKLGEGTTFCIYLPKK
jgi:signal transduction histidine kinase